MADPISHAEMIAAVSENIEVLEAHVEGFGGYPNDLPNVQRQIAVYRAVLAHLERTQWRPIEEAPKDKDWLLVGWESYDKSIAGCSDAAFWHDGSDNYWKHAGWYALEDRGNVLTVKPLTGMTHYMLPPFPETPR